MPIADSKKVQTLINRVADAALRIRADVAMMQDYKARYLAAGIDPTGTPFEGREAALNTALTSLAAEIVGPVWDALIAAKVDSHRGEAL